MRICIDLDGTICESRRNGERYEDVKPIPGAVSALQKLKREGHTIIIHSSRHMDTCNNNIGKIVAIQAPIITEWCKRNQIYYDELVLGKPLADLYIDDKAMRFWDWNRILTSEYFPREQENDA